MATLIGFAGSFWWIFELAAHFRAQYALVLGAFVVISLWTRQWRWAALFGIFALLNTAVIAPVFWSERLAMPTSHKVLSSVNALLANVNVENRDHERIRRTIIEFDPELVVLLETTPWLLERLHDLNERYPHRVAVPRTDPFGIAILSRHPFSSTRIIHLGDDAGPPAIVAVITVNERLFTLIGVHSWPPISAEFAQGRNQQLDDLAHLARQIQPPLLVLGDLNTSPWSPWFARLLADSSLHNSLQGRGIQPSWPVGWPLLWTPLDHILFSDRIQILRREIGPAIGSDHYPVIVEFQIFGP